jgi:hypothetical protein
VRASLSRTCSLAQVAPPSRSRLALFFSLGSKRKEARQAFWARVEARLDKRKAKLGK